MRLDWLRLCRSAIVNLISKRWINDRQGSFEFVGKSTKFCRWQWWAVNLDMHRPRTVVGGEPLALSLPGLSKRDHLLGGL